MGDVQRGVPLMDGCTFGVKYRVVDRAVVFYCNGHGIGTAMLKLELQHQLNALYPAIAMYVAEQQVEVDFSGKMKRPSEEPRFPGGGASRGPPRLPGCRRSSCRRPCESRAAHGSSVPTAARRIFTAGEELA